MDCFQGHHGGRVLPLYRDAAGTSPNIAPGLLDQLSQFLARSVDAQDLLAYIGAVVAHADYTRLFAAELTVPGVRVPLSADSNIWDRAIMLGRRVISLHTAATRYPALAPYQLADPQPAPGGGPQIIRAIPYADGHMPDSVRYDEQTQTLCIGSTGEIKPVPGAVWRYRVGGMRVVDKWIGYRLKNPRGRPPSSPPDTVNVTNWTRALNDDLLGLLHTLGQLVQLEPAQGALLNDVLSNPMIDVGQLRRAGVFPVPESALRPPRHAQPGGRLALR